MSKLSNFISKNKELCYDIAEKNTARNTNGKAVITKDDDWGLEIEWDNIKESQIISSEEALSDVSPIDWEEKVLSGECTVTITSNRNKDTIAFSPGYYIREIIDEMNISYDEFAKRADIPAGTLLDLINAVIPVSDEIALKLSHMFGTSVNLWTNLQKNYDFKIQQNEGI